jgi:hypothetical protein
MDAALQRHPDELSGRRLRYVAPAFREADALVGTRAVRRSASRQLIVKGTERFG